MRRVLVIKLGYRHDLDTLVSREVSAASVVRATPILGALRDDDVTWVTSREAHPLVSGAPGLSRALAYDANVSMALAAESYDAVVNLEPAWEFCALADSVSASERFGFTLDGEGERVTARPGAEALLAWETSSAARRRETRPHPQILFDAIGREWKGEPYATGLRPDAREEFDVGLSMSEGGPAAWPLGHWARLGELLSGRYSISCARPTDDLAATAAWLASCRVVVSTDSAGLYLALALGRKVVGLFGPTSAAHSPLFGRGVALTPAVTLNCIPCHDAECPFAKSCTASITPERAADAVDTLLGSPVSGT